MSTHFTDPLGDNRKSIYNKLSAFADDFILAGGTAIMLQLNHRLSYDFDLFSSRPLKRTLLRQCEEVFGRNLEIKVNTSDFLLFLTEDDIRVDFVYYPFPYMHPLVKEGGIPMFHLYDLAGNKAHTIGRRGTWRDYVDLFFLLKHNVVTLDEIIENAQKRFAAEFADKLFLEQLGYFGDLDIVETNFLQESYTPDEIQNFLSAEVKKYTKKKLSGKKGNIG